MGRERERERVHTKSPPPVLRESGESCDVTKQESWLLKMCSIIFSPHHILQLPMGIVTQPNNMTEAHLLA